MTKRNSFGSFAYSSGESIVATSDSQNVDYGIATNAGKHYNARQQNDDVGNGDIVFNGTRENITSDFGVVNYPFGFVGKKKREKAVSVSGRKTRSGIASSAGFSRGVVSGGGLALGEERPADSIQTGLRGTLENQNEASIDRFYEGQLGT